MLNHWGPRTGSRPAPTDRLPKRAYNNRFVAVNHHGRITALVAEGMPTDPPDSDLAALDAVLDDGATPPPANALPPGATMRETETPIINAEQAKAKIAEIQAKMAELGQDVPRTKVKLTQYDNLELELAVAWDDDEWDPYFMNKDGTFGRKGAFVSTLTAAGPDAPQLVDNPGAAWHAVLCVEGLRTDEDPGREIMPGAVQFPDLPVSLRVQIKDEGGHYGAVTCGRIDEMDRIEQDGYNEITGAGVFGTDEHGQIAQLLVEEQTQRFISIDGRDTESCIVEVEICSSGLVDEYGDPIPDVYEWWFRFTQITIGAATIVATPALAQAVITLANVPLPQTPIAIQNAPSLPVIVADGGPLEPPAAWFDDPGFHVGDSRLIRQRDGKYACPLTVTDEGRIYAHVAYWGQEHTAVRGATPPHSKADYSHYLTGPGVDCADGKRVTGVGQITMGCGHAAPNLRHAPAKAHYDGGYGAIQAADVRMGEDDFGIWIAGAMRSDLSPEDVRKFKATNLSGDWRQIAGSLEMIAVLAGVPVQGFPISRTESLVASASYVETLKGFDPDDGHIISLVAAGIVQREPLEVRMSRYESLLDLLLTERNERLRTEGLDILEGVLN